ncbi:hypothetical protein AGMMS49593_02140 [Endomicrobiia bacterium]|nr:hypothetical protein AGMMS49593_02140 [Endomicrobiia bacterium]
MKSIKNNTSISDFDDFLCKLEEKEEFGCFIIRCLSVFNERCTSVFCILNTSDHDANDGQNNEHEPEERRESGCWILGCKGFGNNKCGEYTP